MDDDPEDATFGSYHLWALRMPPAGGLPGRPSGWGAPDSPVENRQELSAHGLLLLKILSGFSFLVSKNLCLDIGLGSISVQGSHSPFCSKPSLWFFSGTPHASMEMQEKSIIWIMELESPGAIKNLPEWGMMLWGLDLEGTVQCSHGSARKWTWRTLLFRSTNEGL